MTESVLSIRECRQQQPTPRIKGWVNRWSFDGDKSTLPTMDDLPSEDVEEPASLATLLTQRPDSRIKGWVNRWSFDGDKSTLPTMDDLPSENPAEPGLPDDFHYWQPQLLRETFQPDPELVDQFYVATDINLYYDPIHTHRYKRPDWFVVLGTGRLGPNQELRPSYVVWQEELAPYLVVELLSPGTEAEDMGLAERKPDQPPGK